MLMFVTFFIAWVVLSFLAHLLAKYYIQSVSTVYTGDIVALTVAALLVTGIQLLICGLLAFIQVRKPDTGKDKKCSIGLLLMVAIPHMFGALTTNYSMVLIPSASTHLIKVIEPMVTAVLAWITAGVSISMMKLLSLVLVVIGAVGVSGDVFGVHSYQFGIQLALLSSILYASRNVTIKHLLGQDVIFQPATMGKVSILGATMLLSCCTIASVASDRIPFITQYSLIAALAVSAVCHTLYTYISTCVILQYITVIGHALANVAKRMLVIICLYLAGHRYHLSPAFVVVCCLGLFIYIRSSALEASQVDIHKSQTRAGEGDICKSRMRIVILTIVSVALVIEGMAVNTMSSLNQMDSHIQENSSSNIKQGVFESSVQRPDLGQAPVGTSLKLVLGTESPTPLEELVHAKRLIDQPNNTDATMKSMPTASSAVQEAQRIQLQIYKELIGHYKKAILVGIADHENRGDSAITVGELEALNKLGIDVSIAPAGHVKTSQLQKKHLKK